MKSREQQPVGTRGPLDDLAPEASLTRLEEEMRRFWRRHDVPAVARAQRRDGPPLGVYPQPLAVSHPRAAQVGLLATADLLARYQAMQGGAARCRVGWAGHGLPIEVAVEQSLAPEAAGPGLAAFNHACRQRAEIIVEQGEQLADELGLWLEAGDAYVTHAPEAIGSTWGALHRLWQAGRLRQERRVVPFCPRCATALSASEAARCVEQAETLAVWLLLPWEQEPDTYLLVWAPAPWTLVGMVALAAHPGTDYVVVELPSPPPAAPRRLLLAEAALRRQPGVLPAGEYRVVRRLPGKVLRGSGYHPPFTFVPAGEQITGILLSPDVPLEQGTGLMPVTPSFEARSLALVAERDLPLPRLLDDWGRFDEVVSPWRGLSPLDAVPLLVENLRDRGLLFQAEEVPAPRSLCPHCRAPLLPLARRVWLAETGSGSWVLGRDRSWGAPLPLWICDGCGEVTCLAGLDDLAHRIGIEAGSIDPHRPDVDRLAFACKSCGETMRRVPEVVDADFEAAVVPWASAPPGEPDVPSLAVGLGDRHLGWLGDTAELAALLYGSLAWEQAVGLGEGVDRPGWEPERGRVADAQRWAAYTGSTPQEAEDRFLRPLWDLAVAAGRLPEVGVRRPRVGELLDRWLRARLHQALGAVGQALDAADPGTAAGQLAALVDDLVDWYAPQHPEHGLPAGRAGREEASTLCRLLAPFVPHLAEAMYRRQGSGVGVESSVHLAAWPTLPPAWQDETLLAQVALVRRLAALGGVARAAAGLDPDRSLGQGIVSQVEETAVEWPAALQDLLAQALAVERVTILPPAEQQISWRLSLVKDREPEREVGSAAIADALAALGPGQAAGLAEQLRAGLSISVQAGEQTVTLLPDEVRVAPRARPGWSAAAEGALLINLKVE